MGHVSTATSDEFSKKAALVTVLFSSWMRIVRNHKNGCSRVSGACWDAESGAMCVNLSSLVTQRARKTKRFQHRLRPILCFIDGLRSQRESMLCMASDPLDGLSRVAPEMRGEPSLAGPPWTKRAMPIFLRLRDIGEIAISNLARESRAGER